MRHEVQEDLLLRELKKRIDTLLRSGQSGPELSSAWEKFREYSDSRKELA
jgi:hypothetical protein